MCRVIIPNAITPNIFSFRIFKLKQPFVGFLFFTDMYYRALYYYQAELVFYLRDLLPEVCMTCKQTTEGKQQTLNIN